MMMWKGQITVDRFFHVASLVSRTVEAGGGWLPKVAVSPTPPEHLAGVSALEMEECTSFLRRLGYSLWVRPHRTGWEIGQ